MWKGNTGRENRYFIGIDNSFNMKYKILDITANEKPTLKVVVSGFMSFIELKIQLLQNGDTKTAFNLLNCKLFNR